MMLTGSASILKKMQIWSTGRGSWYEAKGLNGPGWLDWCREPRGWLVEEFLQRVKKDKSVDHFFGSWYDSKGWKQTGYFLVCEAINILKSRHYPTKTDILKLDNRTEQIEQVLESLH